MNIKNFFRLIRWPNLLMIILSQFLLQYLLIAHVFELVQMESPLTSVQFILLVLSTVLMAAFGYTYNDVQDVYVDSINKGTHRIIDLHISKKNGKKISWILLLLSLIPALYLSIELHMIQLILIHLFIALGLWHYSNKLKQKALGGNILISIFTAFSIYIVWLYHLVALKNNAVLIVDGRTVIPFINKLVIAYSLFAFIISLIRELVKDVQDMQGDASRNMKTFVIRFGIHHTKILIQLLCFIMLAMTLAAAYYSYSYHWYQLSIYFLVAVGIPLVYFSFSLKKSQNTQDFTNLSSLAKIVMLAGILSMQIFYITY